MGGDHCGSDRVVGALRPGNAARAKGPDFWHASEDGEARVIGNEPANTDHDPGRSVKLILQGEGMFLAEGVIGEASIKRPNIVGLVVKPIGKPSAENRRAQLDERGWETDRWLQGPSYRAHPRLFRR